MEATGQERNENSPHCTLDFSAKGIGFPLWHPEPSQYPPRYQRRGVDVGDVGVTRTQATWIFFSVSLTAFPVFQMAGSPTFEVF